MDLSSRSLAYYIQLGRTRMQVVDLPCHPKNQTSFNEGVDT